MNSNRVLIIGATSAVAQGVAQRLAQQGASIFCLARNVERTAVIVESLGAACTGSFCYDFTHYQKADEAVKAAVQALGGIDIALIAHGALTDQIETEQNFELAQHTFESNLISVISLLIPLSMQMEAQGRGKIGVITSVAGERGRPRNYTYGAAKGSLNIYLQGLRSKLYGSGVEIYTFKMGPVDTPMTVDHPKNFSFSTVEKVSDIVTKAFGQKRYERFVPGYWAIIMFFVRHMPEWLFQRVGFLSGR